MAREDSPYPVGDFWLDKRRDGKSPAWQIAWYDARTRQVRYRSTHKRSLDDAKAVINAHHAEQTAKQKSEPADATVIPMLMLYWKERGRKLINHDQTARSIRTFIGFLMQDEATPNAVVTDMTPVLFERFREWRMSSHSFSVPWGGETFEYSSSGVSGNTVDRNVNDVRAAIGHAEKNGRIPYSPKIGTVEKRYLNRPRDRVLTEDELARIFWYAKHSAPMFRFVALQMTTSVRPEAAKQFDPLSQYDASTGLIDLQPGASPQTKKRNAVIPAIRPMRVVLRAWARGPHAMVKSNKTAWRTLRRTLGLSSDVFPKTIRHTIATWLHAAAVPASQISEMLGHELEMARTSQRYAKYRPEYLEQVEAALSKVWLRISRKARKYGAVHLLSKEHNDPTKVVVRESMK